MWPFGSHAVPCLGIYKLASALSSKFNVIYLDDGTIMGKFKDLQADLQLKALGLFPNVDTYVRTDLSQQNLLYGSALSIQVCSFHQIQIVGVPLRSEAMRCCLEYNN